MADYGDTIFENYELFIKEHHDDLSTPSGAIEMLSSDGAFRAYISSLTEGLDAQTKRNVMAIAERERDILLQESINIGPNAAAIGYAVTHFPVLADIYTDPVLSKIATVYPVDKPVITIPRVRIESSVKNVDGSVNTWRLPSASRMVRGSSVSIDLLMNQANQLHAMSGSTLVSPDTTAINQRYFVINKINVTDSTGAAVSIPVIGRPDARGQVKIEATFDDPSGEKIAVSLVGNMNWNTAIFQYNVTFSNVSNPATPVPAAITAVSATADVMFTARRGDVGRVKVSVVTDGWDVNIDVRDSFEICLDQERIDDYSDIYNLDLVRTLSLAIKSQILYNKDVELGYYLQANEPIFESFGSAATYDVSKYITSAPGFTPANVLDIFKGIIPHIVSVNRNIRRTFRDDPQFIVAGNKTAAVLESLQDMAFNFKDSSAGTVAGSTQSLSGFRKQTILASDQIADDRIYVVYKAPSDNLSRTAIADLVYKPLYVIEETDESQRRTFVKSRSALEITAPEAIGVVKMTNYSDYV